MISGIGIDIEESKRIDRLMDEHGKDFLSRIFTEKEIEYCLSKHHPAQHFTGRFAAKEAFSKAIGTGWRGNFRWVDIEILNDSNGKPILSLHNELSVQYAGTKIFLSLSHTNDYVTAMVVIEQ